MNKEIIQHTRDVLKFDIIIEELTSGCVSELGVRNIRSLSEFLSKEQISEEYDFTEELKEFLIYHNGLPLDGLQDFNSHLDRLNKGELINCEILYDIYTFALLVKQLDNLRRERDLKNYPILNAKLGMLKRMTSIEDEFEDYLEAPGKIRDNATPELARISSEEKKAYSRINEILNRIMDSPKGSVAVQERIITQRDGRYVILVRSEKRQNVRGIIHSRSGSGATLYIEPVAILPWNNKLKELEADKKAEIERITKYLNALVFANNEVIKLNMEILGKLDYNLAKTHFANRFSCIPPVVVDCNQPLKLISAHHPLLLKKSEEEGNFESVPLDIDIPDGIKGVIITGPNMGGKTVSLKTVGMMVLMLRYGLELPISPGTQIPMYDNIIVDIGDEESIEFALSSFASHIRRFIEAIENSGEQTLVLLDELGSATDPDEGGALSWALLDELVENNSTVIVTTHLGKLKKLPSENKRFVNAGMEFDEQRLIPTYKLHLNQPGDSWAFKIAKRLGFPHELLEQAYNLIPKEERNINRLSSELKSRIREYDRQHYELAQEKDLLSELIEKNRREHKEYLRIKTELEKEKEEILEKYLREVKREIHQKYSFLQKQEKEKPEEIPEIKEKLKTAETEVTQRLDHYQKFKEKQRSKKVKQLDIGDKVYALSLRKNGEVIIPTDKKGYCTILINNIRMKIHTSELDDRTRFTKEREKKSTVKYDTKLLPLQIDLRGRIYEQAKEELVKYIDSAYMQRLQHFLIIHGKGKGRLGYKLRDYLQSDRRVDKFRAGEDTEGGDGVTVVTLKVDGSKN